MQLKMLKDTNAEDLGHDITFVGPDETVITRKLLGLSHYENPAGFVTVIVQDEGFTERHPFELKVHLTALVGISEEFSNNSF